MASGGVSVPYVGPGRNDRGLDGSVFKAFRNSINQVLSGATFHLSVNLETPFNYISDFEI